MDGWLHMRAACFVHIVGGNWQVMCDPLYKNWTVMSLFTRPGGLFHFL